VFTNKLLLCVIAIMLSFGGVHALNEMPLLAEILGEHNMATFGWSIVSLDFNHDSIDDLIVFSASYGYQYQQSPTRGKVYIYYGGPDFSSASEPAMTIEGDYPNGTQRIITSLRNIGDVSGDGYDDLVVTDAIPGPTGFYIEGSERYMLFYGGAGDLSAPDRIEFPRPDESFSPYVKLGDVDGDGYGDIGIFYYINYRPYFDIMWGGAYSRQNLLALDHISTSAEGSIIGIGDINNDGFHDFSIGYLEAEQGIDQYSTVRVYYGNSSRVFTEYTLIAHTPSSITRRCKPFGDLNNDGFDDFLGYIDSSGMNVWLGSSSNLTLNPNVSLYPIYFGNTQLRGINSGDFNGDGFSDVIGATYQGRRFAVWLGGVNMDGYADWQKINDIENFGYDVAVGDFNADGCDDIAVSAPNEEGIWPYHNFPGYVFVYAGNTGMVGNDDQFSPPLTEGINMHISPNPVRRDGVMRLSLSGADKYVGMPVNVEVFNIKGQSVYQKEVTHTHSQAANIDLNLSGLASGVYLCRATIGKQAISKKITIIK